MGAIKRRPLDTEFMMGGVEVKLDTAIVLDAQSGSREGFTRLYEAVAPALYRTALYTLGNSHDAEDVVSETFIEAYRGLAGLRDPQAFMTWIYRILAPQRGESLSAVADAVFSLLPFSPILTVPSSRPASRAGP